MNSACIEFPTRKALGWLSNRRRECGGISESSRSARLRDDAAVNLSYFSDAQKSHYASRLYSSAFSAKTESTTDSKPLSRASFSSILVATSCSTVSPRSTAASLMRLATSSGTSKCRVVMTRMYNMLPAASKLRLRPGADETRLEEECGIHLTTDAGEMQLAHVRRAPPLGRHRFLARDERMRSAATIRRGVAERRSLSATMARRFADLCV